LNRFRKISEPADKELKFFTTKTFVTNHSKLLVGDPRSGKNLSGIPAPDPGVKKAADPESSPATLKCCKYLRKLFHSKRGSRVGPGRIMVKILFISSAEKPSMWMQNNDSGEGGDKTILQSNNMTRAADPYLFI
jgi:hypothetical protein